MSFFQAGETTDDAYRNVRDLDHMQHLKDFVEELWNEFSHLADRNFLDEARFHFQERFWEMYLAVSLARRGYTVESNGGSGPDFVVLNEYSKIQLEATAPGPGDGADAVPEVERGVANRVPEDEIILRIRSSIDAKIAQYHRALAKRVVRPEDPFVVAVNGIQIRDAISEGVLPFIVRAVFPFGSLTAVWDTESAEIVDTYFQHREAIEKRSGADVSVDIFNSDEYRCLSAVIYARCDCANHADELGKEYLLVHNPNASNPIPRGLFPFGREYWTEDEELLSRNWNESA